jgi:uncharacterized damage-inducible protein DinB
MNPVRTYDYLLRARAKVLDAVRPLSPDQYLRPFTFGLHTLARTLTHVMISEWYYVERMAGRPVPPYEQWPIRDESPPPFETLETEWREQAERTRAAVVSGRDWARPITWLGFPDEQGRRFTITATAGDFFTQLALHEVHHRAQVMVMLRELGRPVEDLDFNALMFDRQPVA